jgi:hypothetical protein
MMLVVSGVTRRSEGGGMRFPRPLRAAVDWFEARGVYVPGEDNRDISPWRDFGWLIAMWLVTVGLFVIFFALAA